MQESKLELKRLKLEHRASLQKEALIAGRDLVKAALANPAVVIPASYIALKQLNKANVLTDIETGALMAVVTSSSLIGSFNPKGVL